MTPPLPKRYQQQQNDQRCTSSGKKRVGHSNAPKDSRKSLNGWLFVGILTLLVSIEETMLFFITNAPIHNEVVQRQQQEQSRSESTRSFPSSSFETEMRHNFIRSKDKDSSPSRFNSPFRFVASPEMLLFSDEEFRDPVFSMHITSLSEVQDYRWKHQDRIPLDEPIVYVITPTTSKRGLTQLDNLMSFGQTLKLDGNIYWVIVEDTDTCCSSTVRAWLHRLGLPFAHVIAKTNPPKGAPGHRGVDQRNRGLEVVESLVEDDSLRSATTHNTTSNMMGVVYFGDDDNTYDLRLFPALRETKTVGVLPVGFTGMGTHERCIVNRTTGLIMSMASGFNQRRKFPIDMAGFAFHTDLLLPNNTKRPHSHRKVRFNWMWEPGSLETRFMEQLAKKRSDVNPLGDNCTKLYVWHTRPVSVPFKAGPSRRNYWHDVGIPPPPPVFPWRKEHHSRFPNESFDDYNEFAHIASRVGGVVNAVQRDPFFLLKQSI